MRKANAGRHVTITPSEYPGMPESWFWRIFAKWDMAVIDKRRLKRFIRRQRHSGGE